MRPIHSALPSHSRLQAAILSRSAYTSAALVSQVLKVLRPDGNCLPSGTAKPTDSRSSGRYASSPIERAGPGVPAITTAASTPPSGLSHRVCHQATLPLFTFRSPFPPGPKLLAACVPPANPSSSPAHATYNRVRYRGHCVSAGCRHGLAREDHEAMRGLRRRPSPLPSS